MGTDVLARAAAAAARMMHRHDWHSDAFGYYIKAQILTHKNMKQVVLIRHGESLGQIANKNGISRRDPRLTDCFLSPKGIQQASELNENAILNKYQFDLICTSPLTRALATCCLAFGHLCWEQFQSLGWL